MRDFFDRLLAAMCFGGAASVLLLVAGGSLRASYAVSVLVGLGVMQLTGRKG